MRLRELAIDVRDGFLEVRVGDDVVYPASVRDGLVNLAGIARDRAASALLRAAWHTANGGILVQRRTSSPEVPRNVAVALGADALTYAALVDVDEAHPDLYVGGELDEGNAPTWRDQP